MLLDNLPHLATAKRRTRTKDTLGGPKDTYPETLFTDRACWRQPVSDHEYNQWQQRNTDVTHKVYFATDPSLDDLDENCILEIDGATLLVKSLSTPDASVGLGVVWRVMVEEV